jgi:hypothetical protein
VLAGQPCSGKTFLFRELALVDEGLFVIERDMGRIAASQRAEQPPAVMVDDAHPEFLTRLRHLRTHREPRSGFWPTPGPAKRTRLPRRWGSAVPRSGNWTSSLTQRSRKWSSTAESLGPPNSSTRS